MNRFGLW